MLAQLAALCIRLYQRYLSPYKGFRCAHRALHGGPSCSEFARLHALDQGIWSMFPALRLRFQECRAAKDTLLLASGSTAKATGKQKSDPTPWFCDACGGLGNIWADCGCSAAEAASPCDATPVDACNCPCG